MKSTRLSLVPSIPLHLLSGSDGEEDDNDQTGGAGQGDNGDDDGKSDDDAGGDSGKDGKKDDKSNDPAQKKIAALEEEKDRHWQKAKEAEQRADDLAKRLKDLEDKDLGDDEKTKRRLTELETTTETQQERIRELAVENAFLKDNTYQWQNPATALRLADLSKIEIGKDGKVEGMKAALDALAKSDPYLLKPKEGEGDKQEQQKRKTGDGPRRKTEDTASRRAQLQSKYPALRGR